MLSYVLQRIGQSVPVLFIVVFIAFSVVRLVPGDAVEASLGENAPQERVEAAREQLGLNQPVFYQFIDWITGAIQGDFGLSLQKGVPVDELLTQSLRPTLELLLLTYPVALFAGVLAGTLAGARPGSRWDVALTMSSSLLLALPGFLLATILLWLFAVEAHVLPASGYVSLFSDPVEAARHAALPVIALSVGPAAVLARYTRTAVAQVISEPYVRTARAKGLPGSVVLYRHVLRNALIPVITIASLQVGQLLAGAVVVEQIFTRPGMGRLVVTAINNRDYPVVQASLLVLAVGFMAVNLMADLLYSVVDPRVNVR